jgi:Helicase associated domain
MDFRNYMKKEKTTLNESHIQLLINCGFATREGGLVDYGRELIETEWERRMEDLERFYNEEGHCNVSVSKHKTWGSLANWVALQWQCF